MCGQAVLHAKRVKIYPVDYRLLDQARVDLGAGSSMITGVSVPSKFRNAEGSCSEGLLSCAWCAVSLETSRPVCWFRFSEYRQDCRDVFMHFDITDEEERELAMEALCLLRYKAVCLDGVQIISTVVDNAEQLAFMQKCGFELARLEGESYTLEFQKHSSGNFMKYLIISILLAVPAYWIFNRNVFAALCVAFILGLGGGYMRDSIRKQRFLAKRAEIMYREQKAAEK